MSRQISKARLAYLLVGLAIAVIWIFFVGALVKSNFEALRILVMAFSILAGFIIAAITMSGDPKLLYPGSWRIANAHSRNIRTALLRYKFLFYVYLSVIILAFLATLFGGNPVYAPCVVWLERVAVGVGLAALFWSFGLPTSIIRTQTDRLEEEVRRRRDPSSPE